MLKKTILAGALALGSASALPTVTQLMQQLDEQQAQKTDVHAQVQLTQTKPSQGTRQITMEYFRRDKDDAFLILMKAPDTERGNGYLRSGEHMWMYRINTRSFQHINRDESIGGSNAKANDFEKRKLVDLYKPVSETPIEDKVGAVPVYRFELVAKVKDVDYPKVTYWVQKDKILPVKELSYSSNQTLMQSSYFFNYTLIQGRSIPVKMMFVDEFEKGNKTLVELSQIKTDPIPDHIFTKAYLESQSK